MKLSAILSDPGYPKLKHYILTHTGLEYYATKDEDFATRLSRRFASRDVTGCDDYLKILSRASERPSEIDALVGELTIGETYFFRQSEHFELLRTVILPEVLERNRKARRLRIWSAGCAIGAEPYSVAILLWKEFAAQLHDWRVNILGTDINVDFLAQARAGSFSPWTLRDMPETMRAACFRQQGNRWILNDRFREPVDFRYHNLTDDLAHPSPDELPFDLILCRNVMIYFAPDRIRALARRFYDLLNPGGWLLPGHAEYSLEMFSQFDVVRESEAIVYRRPFEHRTPPENLDAAAAITWLPWTDVAEDPPCLPVAAPVPDILYTERTDSGTLEDARILADRGHSEKAEAICRRLIEADALNAPAHLTLGLVLLQRGSSEAALTHLRRAVYADRQFALAYYYLGALLQSNREFAAAEKAFANVLELLALFPEEQPLEHGDGMNAGELRALARMHRELMAL